MIVELKSLYHKHKSYWQRLHFCNHVLCCCCACLIYCNYDFYFKLKHLNWRWVICQLQLKFHNKRANDIMLDTAEEKPIFFYCDMCPRMYQNYSSLKSHFHKKHSKEILPKNLYDNYTSYIKCLKNHFYSLGKVKISLLLFKEKLGKEGRN